NVISGNLERGIRLIRVTDNKIAGNFVGTDATGTARLGNLHQGVYVQGVSTRNIIGTEGDGVGDAAERNVISASGFVGVFITGASHENVVAGNFVGTDVTGTVDLGNGGAGAVRLLNGSHNNRIGTNFDGTSDELERNVISGNSRGVQIDGAGTNDNIVAGNYIGVDVTGQIALDNDTQGVYVTNGPKRNVIDRNVISGNAHHGVLIRGTASGPFPVFHWPAADGGNGHYYVLGPSTTWIDAEATAVEMGGHLASITSAQEQAFLESVLLPTDERFFLGLTDKDDEGNFSWTTGEPVTFTNWNPGQPDNWPFAGPDGEDVGQFNWPSGGTWNDIGSATRNRGIIELDEAPDLDLLAALATTRENHVIGNFIGTNADGTTALPNGIVGIQVDGGAHSNIIGTDGNGQNDEDEGNVISGNIGSGIALWDSLHTTVAGNFIGTDVTGTQIVGNGRGTGFGISVSGNSQFNVIGTDGDGNSDAAERNLISGNDVWSAVFLAGAGTTNNVVAGNLIGTDVTGTLDLGNNATGVEIKDDASFNRIGTNADGVSDALERNIISGNSSRGVFIWSQFAGPPRF
ncbi:MAG: lectin-like protein, partial [Bacteroidota bacterium]